MLALLLGLAVATASPLAATEVRRLPAADAREGVVSGPQGLYAIDNRAIARLDPKSGAVQARWEGDAIAFKHLNSCIVRKSELICAGSNYPELPQDSRIDRFDDKTLRYLGSYMIGAGHGSLTWLDWYDGSWWAGYANYDDKGGMPGRDHRTTTLVRYDADFAEQGHWLFPVEVLARFAPRSSSGGTWGRDGLLYVTGHDRPELYVLRVPKDGDRLELVATIAIPTGGQAIGWDAKDSRLLWSIERSTREVVASRIPEVVK